MPGKTIFIRAAVPEDIPALTELMNELGYKTTPADMALRLQNIQNHPDYKTFISTIDNTVAGMVGATKQFSYQQNGYFVRIMAFITANSFRQMGAGKKLIEAVENWATEMGASAVLVNCGNREERKHAHEFYKRKGFDIKTSGYLKKI